jgi:hypothetical protein
MPVPLPLVVLCAVLVLGLALSVTVVGMRARAIGPGVFILLGGVTAVLLVVAAVVAIWRR